MSGPRQVGSQTGKQSLLACSAGALLENIIIEKTLHALLFNYQENPGHPLTLLNNEWLLMLEMRKL